MVKLTAKNNKYNTSWYFKTLEDCYRFKKVFDNHCCIIYWNPVEVCGLFPEMKEYDWEEIVKDPEERAEKELPWGFNSYMPDNVSIERVSIEMKPIVDMLMRGVTQPH